MCAQAKRVCAGARHGLDALVSLLTGSPDSVHGTGWVGLGDRPPGVGKLHQPSLGAWHPAAREAPARCSPRGLGTAPARPPVSVTEGLCWPAMTTVADLSPPLTCAARCAH
ncbi:hypothetical protein H920_06000 [Fukomys damarensis]|uniref:Uncharacterized protein n=1 Tax=Fukomys damarensis TaxID=885580 RepID=A0A091DKD5_FUKDA|nr:hypothetical protein H920_06000 [Fukomys damarensis]